MRALALVLSIFAVFGGMLSNFPEFLMGKPAILKNVIVTSAYIITWTLILIIGLTSKDRGIIAYCSVFWIITFCLALLMVYVNSADWGTAPGLVLVVLLVGQWYGINFFVGSFLASSKIMALISFAKFVITLFAFEYITKRKNNSIE